MTAALVLALTFTGCSNQSDDKTEAPPKAPQASSEAPAQAPMQEAAAPAEMQQTSLDGTVVETFDSGGYTYIQLDTGSGKIWAAIGQATVAVGDSVSLMNGPVMKDFHSNTLNRTFSEIIFSSGLKEAHAASAPAMGGDAPASFADAVKQEAATMTTPVMGEGDASGGSMRAVTPAQEVKIEKVEGGHTIEEIFASAADLAGQKVKVKGKVVKVSPNIMGRTWIHLQDGTGTAMNNTHDLVITSDSAPAADSIVVAEGVLAKDKDFGAGYFYNVIVEEATFVTE